MKRMYYEILLLLILSLPLRVNAVDPPIGYTEIYGASDDDLLIIRRAAVEESIESTLRDVMGGKLHR